MFEARKHVCHLQELRRGEPDVELPDIFQNKYCIYQLEGNPQEGRHTVGKHRGSSLIPVAFHLSLEQGAQRLVPLYDVLDAPALAANFHLEYYCNLAFQFVKRTGKNGQVTQRSMVEHDLKPHLRLI